jgi:small-conductance mechanosensitive channel
VVIFVLGRQSDCQGADTQYGQESFDIDLEVIEDHQHGQHNDDRVILPNGEQAAAFEIGLRSSKFLTFEHTLIVVPNQELVRSTITNLAYPFEQIRVKVDVGVAYGSNIKKVKEVLLSAAKDHPAVLDDPAPSVFFVNFGESSIDFSLVCRVEKIAEQWVTTEEVRCAVYDKLNAAGIEIPFPQRVVYMNQQS